MGQALVRVLELVTGHHGSQSLADELLLAIKELLPAGNRLIADMRSVHRLIRQLGLDKKV